MKAISFLMVALLWSAASEAKLVTQSVEYRDGDAVLEGYLAYDDSVSGKRPGILVVHEWWGLNDYVKGRAEQLAGLGYIAFAADIYGKGILAKDAQEAGKLAGQYRGVTGSSCGRGPKPASGSSRGRNSSIRAGSPPSATVSAAPRSWNWPEAAPGSSES